MSRQPHSALHALSSREQGGSRSAVPLANPRRQRGAAQLPSLAPLLPTGSAAAASHLTRPIQPRKLSRGPIPTAPRCSLVPAGCGDGDSWASRSHPRPRTPTTRPAISGPACAARTNGCSRTPQGWQRSSRRSWWRRWRRQGATWATTCPTTRCWWWVPLAWHPPWSSIPTCYGW